MTRAHRTLSFCVGSLRACRRAVLVAGVGWLAAACDPAGDRLATEELAGELRALRAALPQAAAASSQPSSAAIGTAMAPVRDALVALAKQQGELAQRQLQLAQEMTQCVAMVAGAVGHERGQAEVAELRQRLAVLERELAGQLQARSDAEAALQRAVDLAADRLERALQTVAPETAAPRPTTKETSLPGTDRQPPTQPDDPARSKSGEAVRKGSAQLWGLVLALTAACGAFWWWRWRRPAEVPQPQPLGMDRGVEEIWAAAELLGEAVGKLRTQSAPAEPASATLPLGAAAAPMPQFAVHPPEPAAAAPRPQPTLAAAAAYDPSELLGLADPTPVPSDEARRVAASPNAATTTLATKLPARRPTKATPQPAQPASVQFVLPLNGKPADRAVASVERVLAGDGRVLRRPAPECLAADGRLAVRCWLLPNLTAAERLHVEQRLRDAVA